MPTSTERAARWRQWIDGRFWELGQWLCRAPWVAIVAVLLLDAALCWQIPGLTSDTSFESFLARDDPGRVVYEEFREQFGRGEAAVVVVSVPSDFSDRSFLLRLRALHRDLERNVPMLRRVTSLVNARFTRSDGDTLRVDELLESIPTAPQALRELDRRVRSTPLYENLLVSSDGRYTALILEPDAYVVEGELSADGFGSALALGDALWEPDLAGAAADTGTRSFTLSDGLPMASAIREVADRHLRPDFELRVGGGLILGAKLTGAIERDFTRLLAIALVVIGALLQLVFRRLSSTLLALAVVLLSLGCTLGCMSLLAIPIGYGTQILPTLLLAVGVGYAVHLLVVVSRERRLGCAQPEAVANAVAHSGAPIALTAITTMGGMMSFASVDLAPVAMIGICAPLGVFFCVVHSLVLLPALIVALPVRPLRTQVLCQAAERSLVRVGRLSLAHPRQVLLGLVAVLGVSLVGISQVRFAHDPVSWIPQEDEFRETSTILDEAFGGAYPIELLFDARGEQGLGTPAALSQLDALESEILALRAPHLSAGKVVGLHGIVKEIHNVLHEGNAWRIPEDPQLVAQELLLFEATGSADLWDVTDPLFRRTRLTARVPWSDGHQAVAYSETLRERSRARLAEHADVTVTGLYSLTSRTFAAVIHAVVESYAIAAVVVTLLMTLAIGSLRGGLVSLIPNLTPILVTLGLMGFLGVPLDTFTLLIGSIILGLAVDDTVHFIHNFSRARANSSDAQSAVDQTLATAGVAMLVTSGTLACGFFLFLLASLANLAWFGVLAGTAILAAFATDVVVCPVLMSCMEGRAPRLGLPALRPAQLAFPARGLLH